jgi:hypothetical protein
MGLSSKNKLNPKLCELTNPTLLRQLNWLCCSIARRRSHSNVGMATTDVESSEQIALGAYEAGAISILCGYLSDEDQKNKGRKDGPLFDIIAGTSIGAMNAAILVSNVVNRKKIGSPHLRIIQIHNHPCNISLVQVMNPCSYQNKVVHSSFSEVRFCDEQLSF